MTAFWKKNTTNVAFFVDLFSYELKKKVLQSKSYERTSVRCQHYVHVAIGVHAKFPCPPSDPTLNFDPRKIWRPTISKVRSKQGPSLEILVWTSIHLTGEQRKNSHEQKCRYFTARFTIQYTANFYYNTMICNISAALTYSLKSVNKIFFYKNKYKKLLHMKQRSIAIVTNTEHDIHWEKLPFSSGNFWLYFCKNKSFKRIKCWNIILKRVTMLPSKVSLISFTFYNNNQELFTWQKYW